MKRETLEHHQVWIYLTAVLAGLAVGSLAPDAGPFLEILLWPALAFLLYATFTQVPIMQLPDAFRDVRFMAAALIGNFAILPILVWIVLFLVPRDPAIQLGVMLVLLVPCTDWFITFAHQAGGDTRRAIAITPALLLLQIVFLPVYLRLFMGEGFSEIVSADRMMIVFVIVIVLPLAFAWATERWAARDTRRTAVIERLSWLPVPLLAFVLFLIAASQIEAVLSSVPLLGQVLGAFVLFLIGAAFFGVL
ncbi:MAG: arsenic resistance protein, partial [Thermaurantiacus sp.]